MFLLVEDEPLVARALLRIIREHHPDARHAATLAAARAAIAEVPLDGDIHGMVLDLGLPDGEGLTLLQELRRERPYFPVLVYTATFRPEIANRLDTLRAQYCCKPALENVSRFALETAARGTPALTAHVGTLADQQGLSPAVRALLLSCVVEEPMDEFLARRDIVESTYRSQLRAIRKKMGKSASELATNFRRRLLRR